MPRSLIKLGILTGGLVLIALASPPARAQNPTTAGIATNVPAPDVRAHIWAATARYVYHDDPALASLRPQLLKTIDSSSVKSFGRRLEEAVRLEHKALPKQGHLLKFLELFKTASTSADQPNQLATAITNTLLANKPERKSQPSFAQLSGTLHTLASPPAAAGSTPVADTAPASPDTSAVAAPPVAAAPAAVSTAGPAYLTPISSTPMIAWVALALSIISLLIALFKSNSRGRHRHSSSSTLALTTLTDEMRAEVRTMVQREVGKLPGARPAADAPARSAGPAPAAPPKSAPAKAATAAPAPKAAPRPAPEPAAAVAPTPPASPAEPVVSAESAAAAQDDTFFDENYPIDTPPVAPPSTRTLYANQQPMDGIFKRDMLAEAPASYTIFELITGAGAPDQAQFVVTSNAAGHAGYIGSHQNILGGACEYPFPKGSVSRIITDTPGQAQRTATGDWQITRKAQVHFE
ncbi:hypothetical protein GCM10023172_22140 [Hymenobacter ginsengisoli]|uniref:Uncharacterized protein n=1 Tax=Hymenobacter ginsengisoli TaxID=1051626 RepID=A0ABP8QER8_9BACT|nr:MULTISPECIES: hypothetical protein [unclassified Hymenobacter]MBO2032021.1 hypothetical protein [Hymenobacter sp. BT559]